jgi:hypothetical protein
LPQKKKPKPKPLPKAPKAKRPKDSEPAAQPTPSIVPKKCWVQWSGRQYKILDEQAQRYGIPVGGPTIDLAEIAVWIHDLLATHGRRILAGDSAEDLEVGTTNSPALERKREVEYEIRLRELAQIDKQLVSRDMTRQCHAVAASIFKDYGQTVQKKYGADALDLWNQTLNAWERAVDAVFGEGGQQSE